MPRKMVVTATGDALISRRLPEYQHSEFQGMLDLIRSTDVAFTNMEIVLTDFEGHHVLESGGINISADPRVAGDLKNLGFNLMAFANNHTLNYGEHGCLRTLEVLDEYDIVCAGAGRHLAEARMPRYLETLNGRVGLMACASTFGAGQHAAAQRPDVAGRPGLNPQRYDRLFVVDQEHYDSVKRIAEKTGAEKWREWRVNMGFGQPPKREGELSLADRSFIVGDEFEIRTEPHEGDLKGNSKSLSDAAALSDLTIASMHCHEPKDEMWETADFIPEVARAFIDAGADMFLGHGPHMLRGLEIYKGKPIFYSLGNFIFQPEYVGRVPADDYSSLKADESMSALDVFMQINANDTRSFFAKDRYWETVLPMCTFEDRQLTSIELHPISLGPGQSLPGRGTPELAQPDHGQQILEQMIELSKPFGTEIEIRDGVGVVKV
jgi:poly-gamma-glutamate capsule biosynthesis protein CapA/YwtB (metallophosphatase superfamily)